MPTQSLMVLPKSSSADEFEIICKDVLKELYLKDFTRYGRQGQKQHGIDIYSKDDDDLFIVAQCKNYYRPDSAQRLINQIEQDIIASKKSDFNIKAFIAMTSYDRDTSVQDAFKRSHRIRVIFWDEIQETVCRNKHLLLQHYPSFLLNMLTPIEVLNEIIGQLNSLFFCASKFQEMRNYRVGYNERTDVSAYKHCIRMFSEASDLYKIMNGWNLQLDNLGILKHIKEIVESIPETHDENEDGTGSSMIITVHNYINYFCEKENYDVFKSNICKADAIVREHSNRLYKTILPDS